MTPGRYLHRECVARGWVRNVPPRSDKGPSGKSAAPATGWVFVLTTGATTKRPIDQLADRNVQACLQQRFDAEWSIMAAADYGKANLALLMAKGFRLSGLGDSEKAKLMYLMHHEGEGNGPLFIRDQLARMSQGKFDSAAERMAAIFSKQVRDSERQVKNAGGDIFAAYRRWLSSYIDEKIVLQSFTCRPDQAVQALGLSDVLEEIGGAGV